MSVRYFIKKGLGVFLLASVLAPLATQASNRCHGDHSGSTQCKWFSENPNSSYYGKERCVRSYMETKPLNFAQCQWVGNRCVAGAACHIK